MTPPNPNFFIIGASKSGTTAVAEALGTHLDISMSKIKEPNFFIKFDSPNAEITETEFQAYLTEHFSDFQTKVIGEASVGYLLSRRAAEFIYRFFPNAKLLVILRNPMERTRSLYEMAVRHGYSHSFHHALCEDGFLLRQNFYHDQIKRYTDLFQRDQLLILEHSDLRSQWTECVRKILVFLEVDPQVVPVFVERNMGGLPKRRWLKFLSDRRLVKFSKSILPSFMHAQMDRTLKKLLFHKLDISPSDAAYMRENYIEDIRKVDSLLGSQLIQRWFPDTGVTAPQPLADSRSSHF